MIHAGDSANMPPEHVKHILASHGGARRSFSEEITCRDFVSSVSFYLYGFCLSNEITRPISGRDCALHFVIDTQYLAQSQSVPHRGTFS